MAPNTNPRFPELAVRHGTLVVDGYGLSLRVSHGRLLVEDGLAGQHRRIELSRPTCGLKRLILLGSHGYFTLESLRWVSDVGAGFAQLDRDGRILMTSSVLGRDDARLRRAQALASVNGVGLDLARELIRKKVSGQARVLESLGVSAPPTDVDALDDAPSTEAIMLVEAVAALAHWDALAATELRFDRASEKSLPDHWRTIGARGSGLGSGARLATNPANAVLNYCYALAEVECSLGLAAVGLDPGLGVLHADQRSRDSLALDLLEVIRPSVDAFALDLFRTRTFRSKDFRETRQGNSRILAPLTHELAKTLDLWRREVAPAAEWLARSFADSSGIAVPTPLTQTNRSRGRGNRRRVTAPTKPRALAKTCAGCGEPLLDPARKYCKGCAASLDLVGDFSRAGHEALAKLRAEGKDPMSSAAARRKIAETKAANDARREAWEREHPEMPPPEAFTRDILPGLQGVSATQLRHVTGLSLSYCSQVRRGIKIPHPMHWEAFAAARVRVP